MKFRKLHLGAVAFCAACIGAAEAATVDLSSWVAESSVLTTPPGAFDMPGNWVLEPGANAVLQTVNGRPTVFHNNMDSQGMQLGGTIEVQTMEDNDFVGFVLGYNAGDFGNAAADYLLIDWRQGTQNLGCGVSTAGLSISRVSGSIEGFGGTGCHINEVTELARAATLGDTGWEDNREYTFELIFTDTLVQVLVDGVLELSVAGIFSNGGFGFYNSSQADVRYAGIIAEPAEIRPIPIPAAAPLMGSVLLLGGLIGRLRRRNAR